MSATYDDDGVRLDIGEQSPNIEQQVSDLAGHHQTAASSSPGTIDHAEGLVDYGVATAVLFAVRPG